tara:strand:- start:17374 stop:18150 length:777 start_codon:yes stop_codon:yes gene_type:complete
MDKNKIGLLVISCDNYSDLWDPFFKFFHLAWHDCPYKIHLLTNHLEFESDYMDLEVIKVGDDKSWSDNLIKGLEFMGEYDYVLLFLEDMLLNRKVENERIFSLFSDFFKLDGNFLSLLNEPKPTKSFNDNFGILEKKALYRSTATATLWKKNVLIKLLKPGESAWAFEKKGSVRSDVFSDFYSVYKDEIIWINAVIKNKWTYPAIREFKRRNILIDSKRERISITSTIFQKLYLFIRSIILKIIPFKIQRTLFKKYSD